MLARAWRQVRGVPVTTPASATKVADADGPLRCSARPGARDGVSEPGHGVLVIEVDVLSRQAEQLRDTGAREDKRDLGLDGLRGTRQRAMAAVAMDSGLTGWQYEQLPPREQGLGSHAGGGHRGVVCVEHVGHIGPRVKHEQLRTEPLGVSG